MRILRLLKLIRYVKALDRIVNALKDRSIEIVIALALISFLVLISATLMYYAEKEAQPDAGQQLRGPHRLLYFGVVAAFVWVVVVGGVGGGIRDAARSKSSSSSSCV